MTTYIIDTQGMENYGAHSEDGKFSNNNHYWKFKGGSSYKVTGLDRPQDAMAFIAAIGMEMVSVGRSGLVSLKLSRSGNNSGICIALTIGNIGSFP